MGFIDRRRGDNVIVNNKISIATQRAAMIAAVLLAGAAWTMTSVQTVNGQSPPGSWTMKAPLPARLGVKEYTRTALDMSIAGAIDYARNLHSTLNAAAAMRPKPK